MRKRTPGWLAALLGVLAWSGPAFAQQGDRRDRQDPELLVESGGRMGTCDVLTFTADGNYLLAAGDDKVVRVWPYRAGQLDSHAARGLRWGSWREQRGAIYALALSPDPAGKRVAIGGLGLRNSSVAVLDRVSGAILHTVTPERGRENFYGVMALAFAPSGKRLAYGTADGTVWLWDFKRNRRLGKQAGKKTFNRIRLLHFFGEQQLLSVAEDGAVVRWDLGGPRVVRTPLLTLAGKGVRSVFRAVLSPDGQWLAAATQGPLVAVRSLDGKGKRDIKLEERRFARSLAFDRRGRLAVGVGVLVPSKFYLEANDLLRLYDLPDRRGKPGPPHTFRADCLAFHPDGKHLAVAGGDNQEVTLWDLANTRRPASVVRGAGSGLWDVTLTRSGRYLGIRDRRDPNSPDPDARARGPWRFFDLFVRRWAVSRTLKPSERLTELRGWHVEPSPDPYVWYAVHSSGARHKLPLDRDRDGMPRCYAFLPPGKDRTVRLAVGHYWGLSLFSLKRSGVRRQRLCVGHQGEVTALAPSADSKWLVSASLDQTVAAWDLGAWPSQAELGAAFRVKGGRLFVRSVDLFSPAWEAGLVKGDEVVLLAVAARKVFDRTGSKEFGPAVGKAAGCLPFLENPEPGKELFFGVRRPGRKGLFRLLTTVRQRPLWRFFPARGPAPSPEWVLWMWRYHYYDTSTNGDSYVGWQLNDSAGLTGTPTFYRAEQFRGYFHRPAVIDKLLGTRNVKEALESAGQELAPPDFRRLQPAAVSIRVGAAEVHDQDVKVTVSADPQSDNPDRVPDRAELWVNDYRLKVWHPSGPRFRATVRVPKDKLRAGDNDLTFQCYNRVAGRGQGRAEAQARVKCVRERVRRRLYGVMVGIEDYTKSSLPGGARFPNLPAARNDAATLRAVWEKRSRPLFAEAHIKLLEAPGGVVNRAAILEQLRGLAARTSADDLLVLFLAGHGDLREEEGRSIFVFCGPDYSRAKKTDGLTSEDLYTALAAIPCRKFVLLDACRSGDLRATPVRDLTPGGRGPTILAACDRSEQSWEDRRLGKGGHGLFSYAVAEALGKGFARADRSRDGRIDAQELYDYALARLPALLKAVGKPGEQNPTHFPAELERFPLAAEGVRK
jgi:WD40 repeat protein